MADVLAAASPAAPVVNPKAEKSDGKKSGNVSLAALTRSLKLPPAKPAGEKLTGDAAPLVKPSESTPVAEASDASRTSPAVTAVETAPAPTEPVTVPPAVTEEETPTDLSQLSNLDPKTKALVEGLLKQQKERTQALIDKRINKEVLKTKTLQDELVALRGQTHPQLPINGLLPLPAPVAPQPAPVLSQTEFPLPEINDMNALAAKQREADGFRQKADDALAIGPDEEGRFIIDGHAFNKQDVVNIRREATKVLNVDIPQRAQYLNLRTQAVKLAYEEFPWLKDQASTEYQQASGMLNSAPWIKNMPNAELFLGLLVEGHKSLDARKKASAQPVVPVVTKQRPPSDQTAMGGGASSTSRNSNDARAKQVMSAEIGKLSAKGKVTIRDVAGFLARKEQLSQSR